MTPFDFINAISFNKKNLFEDPMAKKDYKAFLVNKGLSYYVDTVHNANHMNMNYHIPEDWQFSYLLNSIPRKKRFSPWEKKDKKSEDFLLVKEFFGYSSQKTSQAMRVLTEEQIAIIRDRMFKGGKN